MTIRKKPSITDIELDLPRYTELVKNDTIMPQEDLRKIFRACEDIEYKGRTMVTADNLSGDTDALDVPGRPGSSEAWEPLLKACESVIFSTKPDPEASHQAWQFGLLALKYCPGPAVGLQIAKWPTETEKELSLPTDKYKIRTKADGLATWLGFGRHQFSGYHPASDILSPDQINQAWDQLTIHEQKYLVQAIISYINQGKMIWPESLPVNWIAKAFDGPILGDSYFSHNFQRILNRLKPSHINQILPSCATSDIPWQELEYLINGWKDTEWSNLSKEALAILLVSPIKNARLTAIKKSAASKKQKI